MIARLFMCRRFLNEPLEQRLMLSGDSIANAQYLHQDVEGILDRVESNDRYGAVLAKGFFNRDEFLDLAIAVPGESGDFQRGAVNVIYGNKSGLDPNKNELFLLGDLLNDEFGGSEISALASGDFNGDQIDDLAIGVRDATVGDNVEAGAVSVIYGTPLQGLNLKGRQTWHQDLPGILDMAEREDRFGQTLVAGNFNDDLFADLAIGIPHEDLFGERDAGAVSVIYGSPISGLATDANQFWYQGLGRDDQEIPGVSEAGDEFGASLAAGDFNRDENIDLAIGIPGEDLGSLVDSGAVTVIYGNSLNRLIARDSQRWHQDIAGMEGEAAAEDRFGTAVAAGDFDDDGYQDLAIGIPGKEINGVRNAGAVQILYGDLRTISALGNEVWHQDIESFERAEPDDRFGSVLSTGDLQPENEGDELIVGVPEEDLDSPDVGVVHILGTRKGSYWHFPNAQSIRPSAFGLAEDSGEQFGAALATGEPSRFPVPTPIERLMIGIPFDSPTLNGGAVIVVDVGIDVAQPQSRIVNWRRSNRYIDGVSVPAIVFAIAFSEKVVGFDSAKFQVEGIPGAAPVRYVGSRPAIAFSVVVVGMTTSGQLFARVPEGIAVDLAGQPTAAIESIEVPYTFKVQASFRSIPPEDNIDSERKFEITFNRTIEDLVEDDFTVLGSSLPQYFSVDETDEPNVFILTVGGMTKEGSIDITLDKNLAPHSFRPVKMRSSFLFSQPTVLVDPGGRNYDNTSAYFKIEFSRPVRDFSEDDIVLTGPAGTRIFRFWPKRDNSRDTYILEIAGMREAGPISVHVPSCSVVDDAGATNLESNVGTLQYQTELVRVHTERIVDGSQTENGREAFVVRFSEPVHGFGRSDLSFEPLIPNDITITGEGTDYEVSFRGLATEGIYTSILVNFNSVVPRNYRSDFSHINAMMWTNRLDQFDVNRDGFVTARDVLLIVNELNSRTHTEQNFGLIGPSQIRPKEAGYFDVNRDRYVTPRDVLMVVNQINAGKHGDF